MKLANSDAAIRIDLNNEGRFVYVNTDIDRFCMVPSVDLPKVSEIANIFLKLRKKSDANSYTINPENRKVIEQFNACESREQVENAIIQLLIALSGLRSARSESLSAQRTILFKMVNRLWADGVLLFPGGTLSGSESDIDLLYANVNWPIDELSCGNLFNSIVLINEIEYTNNKDYSKRCYRRLRDMFSCLGPINSMTDLNDSILQTIGEKICPKNMKIFANLVSGLTYIANNQRTNGIKSIDVNFFVETFSPSDKKRENVKRSNKEFYSFTEKDQQIERWRKEASDYIKTFTNRKNIDSEVNYLNKFLDFVVEKIDVPRDPVNFLRCGELFKDDIIIWMGTNVTSTISIQSQLATLKKFFNYILERYCMEESDDGESLYIIQGYKNPLNDDDIPSQDVRSGQTHRIPMPTRFLEVLKKILVDNNFSWCKKHKEDCFVWTNPETGNPEKIWSPVRAGLILLRTLVPIRNKQAAMLDSGEGDKNRYDQHNARWVKNEGSHANYWKNKGHHRGVLKKIWDPEKEKYFVGLYINTNKTQDRQKQYLEVGYDIPWHNKEIVDLISYIRDFQEKFNPVKGPCPFTMTSEPEPTPDVLARIPERFYLYRDASTIKPYAPVTDGRMKHFWRKLMRELERRLPLEGILNDDGTTIQIMESETKAIFDLHGLRVTTLTAFARNGVPIEILSKVVAGHASIVMTLHYTKFDISHVTELLEKASNLRDKNSQKELAGWLKTRTIEEQMTVIAFNNIDGFKQMGSFQSSLWRFMDHGICPNGGTKCNEGGEALIDHKDRKKYGPIEGGACNCVSCRFFVTGPQFLLGLKAKFDETSFLVEESATRFRKFAFLKSELQDQKMKDHNDGIQFERENELRKAQDDYSGALHELNVLCNSLHDTFNLGKQSLLLLEKNELGDKALNLITNARDKSIINECSTLDLVDEICQEATFFPSINCTQANRARSLMVSRLVLQSGKVPMFLTLSEEQQKKAMDASMAFLYKRHGRDILNDAVDNKCALPESFIYEMEKEIETAIGKNFSLSNFSSETLAIEAL